MKKENWTKAQLVGISEKFNPKATVEYIKYYKEMHDPDEKFFKKVEC